MAEVEEKVSLASLLTPSKTVTIDYPGIDGFEVDLCYLAREELLKLRNKCLSQKFNKKTRAFEEQLDESSQEEAAPAGEGAVSEESRPGVEANG